MLGARVSFNRSTEERVINGLPSPFAEFFLPKFGFGQIQGCFELCSGMGMDSDIIDALEDSSRFEFLRLGGVPLENCEQWDEDYLEFLQNFRDKSVEEPENDKDLCSKDFSDKGLNGCDHVVNSVGKSENEDDDDAHCNILDKSVEESENDEDLNGHDHFVDLVGKSDDDNPQCNILDKSVEELENHKDLDGHDHFVDLVGKSDDDDPQRNILDKSVEELENDKDLNDEELNGHDHFVDSVGKSEDENSDDDGPQCNILGESVEESESDRDLSDEDLNGHDHFVDSVGESENENSDYDDPQYKFFLSHIKCHGKSFTFEYKEENVLSKIMEYQKEESIDGKHDLRIDSNMDNVVEREKKWSRSEPKNSKKAKKNSFRSVPLKKGNAQSHKQASRKQSASRLQPKSNKDGLGKMGEEEREQSLRAERHVIKREQDPLAEDDYRCFLDSAEIVSGRINIPLESDKILVYDEQVDMGDALCHEARSMSPRSSGKNNVEEDDSCQIVDVGHQTDQLKEKVMAILRKPFDEEEYNTLWHLVTQKNHNKRHKELRHGRERLFTTENKAKSYLEQHKDLWREIEVAKDDKLKRLNILRGFFFWLQHVAWGPFKPWKDASCLAVKPGSH